MAGETPITIIGNLTADPELRFTPSGAAVANFTVASTPRTFDRQTNEWRDGDAMFLNCAVWRQYAENVAESLTKGMRVIVNGNLKSRQYETREGERRTVFEVDVNEVVPPSATPRPRSPARRVEAAVAAPGSRGRRGATRITRTHLPMTPGPVPATPVATAAETIRGPSSSPRNPRSDPRLARSG